MFLFIYFMYTMMAIASLPFNGELGMLSNSVLRKAESRGEWGIGFVWFDVSV